MTQGTSARVSGRLAAAALVVIAIAALLVDFWFAPEPECFGNPPFWLQGTQYDCRSASSIEMLVRLQSVWWWVAALCGIALGVTLMGLAWLARDSKRDAEERRRRFREAGEMQQVRVDVTTGDLSPTDGAKDADERPSRVDTERVEAVEQ